MTETLWGRHLQPVHAARHDERAQDTEQIDEDFPSVAVVEVAGVQAEGDLVHARMAPCARNLRCGGRCLLGGRWLLRR